MSHERPSPGGAPPGVPALSPAAAAGLTFLAAGSVLVLEIAAIRLLAPFVGVTLSTYTAIIGVILAGIAAGAWIGGRLADRLGPAPLLGPAFVAGGLAAMAAVPIVTLVGSLDPGTDAAGSVLLAGLGFVTPATLLSAVGPIVVRATLTDVGSSGTLVGRLSAIGTAGAITGTFLTGFILLGLIPTRWLILGTGALLVVVGVVLGWRQRRAGGTLASALLVATLGAAVAAAPDPCQLESRYYCIAVTDDPGNATGRTLVLDRLRHAYVDLNDPSALEFRYVRWFDAATHDLVAANPGIDVLHVGGGGFSFPRHLAHAQPRSRHTVLELDPVVVQVARDQLGFAQVEPATIVTGDARLSIRGLREDAYDLVVGDAFGGLSVPWHLTTVEFLAEVDRVLRPDGRYIMNIIDGPQLRFARAEAATLGALFEHVAVVATRATVEGRSGGNVVLVASHDPLDEDGLLAAAAERGDAETVVIGQQEMAGFTRSAPILRDDYAPVDQLIGS